MINNFNMKKFEVARRTKHLKVLFFKIINCAKIVSSIRGSRKRVSFFRDSAKACIVPSIREFAKTLF